MNRKLTEVAFAISMFICLISCNHGTEVAFYVTNNSEHTKDNTIQVYINDSLLISKNFRYSNVVPNDEIFKFRLKNSVGKLKVVELTYGMETIDSIDIDKEKYIFIGFDEFKKNLPGGDTVKRIISILKRKEFTKLY